MLQIFMGLVALTLVGLVALRYTRFRGHPWDIYYPRLAWLRAGIYFCCCYLLAWVVGVTDALAIFPLTTPAQWANPNWVLFTLGYFGFIVLAYTGVWCYYTPVFERQRNTLVSAGFGLLWGSSSGLLFLAVLLLVERLGLPAWGTWIGTFLILGAWQPNWHSIYWDHYIAPEHDTPMTQKIKALGCHIPNLVIGLTWLMLYRNYHLFILAQVIACTSAAVGMRYPAPWVAPSAQNYAHRSQARIPRCTGYVPKDPRTDPYTPFYPGWRGRG